MDYSEAVDEMREDISGPDEFGFEEYMEQVESLGNPQNEVKTIHVAGTNGKGSTCNILYEILRKEGYSVGLFTGPNLGELTERIEVDGQLIKKEETGDLYEEIRNENFSMFESLVMIAFKYYIKKDVDVAVIETGSGGKRDATNIVEPEVSVITNVGLDHSHILGETVPEIAEEKAGIIKEGKTVVTNAEDPALEVIERKADEKSSELTIVEKIIEKTGESPLEVRYSGEDFKSGLRGDYQLENMNTALEALESSGFEVSDEAIIEGLKKVKVPGRMEKISEKPEIFVDGAHNRKGIEALGTSIDSFDTIVFGFTGKKSYGELVELLRPFGENFIFTVPEDDKAWSPEAERPSEIVVSDPVEAVEAAEGKTLVTGSLYLVGTVREEF